MTKLSFKQKKLLKTCKRYILLRLEEKMSTNHVVFNLRILSYASAKAYYKAFSKEVQMHPEADADIISHILLAYFAMKEALRFNKGVNVTYDIGGISPCMGVVSISGKTVLSKDTKLFKDVKDLATNFEVYLKTDGTIQMNFGFHGLKRKEGNK